MTIKKCLLWVLLACALLYLAGCGVRERVLVTPAGDGAPVSGSKDAASPEGMQTENPRTDEGEHTLPEGEAKAGDPNQDEPTQNDPDARRREYASDASAELSPDAEQALEVQQDFPEAPAEGSPRDAPGPDARQAEAAPLTVTETLAREEAERLGVSEQAPKADAAYQYYRAMLESRLSAMFECERLYVYWETPVDYQTVFKASDAHDIILLAGGYDIAAKRLEDALMVDDGWVIRKNPGCIVKCVDPQALGDGAQSAAAIYAGLMERPGWASIGAVKSQAVLLISSELLDSEPGQLAAALYMAKVMYPDSFADLDPNEAWQLLREEGTGTAAKGVYAYTPRQTKKTDGDD